MFLLKFTLLSSLGLLCYCHYLSDGLEGDYKYPQPWRGHTSPGDVWPKPQIQTTSNTQHIVDISDEIFQYSSNSFKCDILIEAFRRYGKMIRKSFANSKNANFGLNTTAIFTHFNIYLYSPCEDYPQDDMDESYQLEVMSDEMIIEAKSVWGMLRGIETASQLLHGDSYGHVLINETQIMDFPRFNYRGVLLDTSRHYLSVDVIKTNIEAMAYNKYNVFHWHIVDYQSFPYVSTSFPDLSAKGAYDQFKIYTPVDVHEIIEFARLRGIRVVPEFDTPGHTESWGFGQPGLLTPCYTKDEPDGTYGPVNPILNSSYNFIEALFKEVRGVFKDKFIHLGGDEVSFNCWKSNPDINTWMNKYNISGNYSKLEEFYINNVLEISSKLGFNYIVWQEVVDNGCKVDPSTIVEVWIFYKKPMEDLAKITKMGLRAIITAPWYLNRISYGQDWTNLYTFEPYNFNGTAAQKKLVIGGEACMWGEYVDETNITPRLWPRASAVAERLWSDQKVNNTVQAAPRLHEHRCRMVKRGIPAEPLSPSYCPE